MNENALTLRTLDNRTAFAPGEEITVVAEWQLADPSPAAELRLVWYTQGKGDEDIQIVDLIAIPAPRAADSHRWTVRLPDSPFSFSGKLITLTWAIELVFGTEHSLRLDIVIAPSGREVLLHKPAVDSAGNSPRLPLA